MEMEIKKRGKKVLVDRELYFFFFFFLILFVFPSSYAVEKIK